MNRNSLFMIDVRNSDSAIAFDRVALALARDDPESAVASLDSFGQGSKTVMTEMASWPVMCTNRPGLP